MTKGQWLNATDLPVKRGISVSHGIAWSLQQT